MDKKNTVIGVLLLVAAMASFYVSARYAPQPPPKPPAETTPASSFPGQPLTPAAQPATSTLPGDVELKAAAASSAPAERIVLQNDFIAVTFTTAGGAIDRVALRKYPAVLNHPEPYLLNSAGHQPALSLSSFPGADAAARYELVSRTDTEVVYRAVVPNRLEITRRYSLAPGAGNGQDPYQIRHETTFRNLSGEALALPRASFNLGTSVPVNEADYGMYLNVGYYNGEDFDYIGRSKLEGGGFLSNFGIGSKTDLPFIDRPTAVQWAAVKNQFFASILTPVEPGSGVRIERVKLNPLAPDSDRNAYGVTGWAHFDLKPVAAGATATWKASYYTGPKEYRRLADSKHFAFKEDLVMQFGFFGFFAKILLTLLTWVHSWLPSWGWAVVVATLILKTVTLPFTLAASRSSKRMQKLMPQMNVLREKFKDQPAKLQEGMMKLYKDNKVNPLGGCIPVLITIPFFIGFFSMLQSASELRFQAFMWAPDLSAPDTVARVLGLPLNIMPLLMGATMIIQMKLTPTPTTDPAQATMMKVMPYMFTLFCYNFSCALALYSTVNGIYTIVQQIIVNRLPEPELAGAAADDGLKNVTPKKKK